MRFIKPLDDTWRLVQRGVPRWIGPEVDGKDCYFFQRKGGEKATDLFTTHVMPVELFWGKR